MIYTAALDREKFLAWIGSKFTPVARKVNGHRFDDRTAGGVNLIWNEPPYSTELRETRPILAVNESDMREFFAFVGTYVSTYKPFSAYFRVVSTERLPDLLVTKTDLRYRNSFVGAIIAEAKLQGGEKIKRLSDLTVQGCLATMSRTAVEALLNGSSLSNLDRSLDRWVTVRSRLGGAQLRVNPARIHEFWGTVALGHHNSAGPFTADAVSTRIANFLSDVIGLDDDVDPLSWNLITSELQGAQRSLAAMRLSREQRLETMDYVVLDTLSADIVDIRIREVVLGYLASRLASGSMSYLWLLDRMEAKLPLATLWFGLFLSLRSDTDAFSSGDCLGRRVARDIGRSWTVFSEPTADLSFEEFDTLTQDSRSGLNIRTGSQTSVTIEIAPGQLGLFRVPGDARSDPIERGFSLPPEALFEIRDLVGRVGNIVSAVLHGSRQQEFLLDAKPNRPVQGRPKRSR
jgi:hypothetical protein